MIWEALLWSVLAVGEAVEAPLEWIIPEDALNAYRSAVSDYGVSAIASLSRFFNRGSLAFLAFSLTAALTLTLTYMALRVVRAIREWLP